MHNSALLNPKVVEQQRLLLGILVVYLVLFPASPIDSWISSDGGCKYIYKSVS